MADHLSTSARSENMRRVKGKNTKPELAVRKAFHKAGYRYRLHRKDLPGSPDLFLPKYRVAVFVHGCFWHGHEGCKRSALPSTRSDFWSDKIARNVQRDARALEALEVLGISALVIWECESRSEQAILACLQRALSARRECE